MNATDDGTRREALNQVRDAIGRGEPAAGLEIAFDALRGVERPH